MLLTLLAKSVNMNILHLFSQSNEFHLWFHRPEKKLWYRFKHLHAHLAGILMKAFNLFYFYQEYKKRKALKMAKTLKQLETQIEELTVKVGALAEALSTCQQTVGTQTDQNDRLNARTQRLLDSVAECNEKIVVLGRKR